MVTENDTLEVAIQPLVGWPTSVVPGGSYLVTVDLKVVEGTTWPYDEEEFSIGCMLDGRPYCRVRVVGDAGVVLHRFGGTYGPARFIAEVPEQVTIESGAALWLTLTTAGGVPFYGAELRIDGTGGVGETVKVPAVSTPAKPGQQPVTVTTAGSGGRSASETTQRPERGMTIEWSTWLLDGSRHVPMVNTGEVMAIALMDVDGRTELIAGGGRTLWCWDVASGELLREWQAHSSLIRSVAAAHIARPLVVSGGLDTAVKVWDRLTGEVLAEFALGPRDKVSCLAIGELGEAAMVVMGDRVIRIWNAASGQSSRELAAQANSIALGVVGGRQMIISGGQDNLVRLWDAATGQPAGELRGHVGPVRSVAFGHLGNTPVIVSGSSGDNTVRLWDAASLQTLRPPMIGHSDGVTSVAIGHLDGRAVVASGGRDKTIRIWNPEADKPWHTIDVTATTHSMAFNDGRLLSAGTSRGIVTLGIEP